MAKNLEGKIEALELEKEDKFSELKKAHKNGAVIQFKSHFKPFEWIDDNNPSWSTYYEYRIKPEEKPKLQDSDIDTIEALHDVLLDNHKYDFNSKLLTNAR